MTPSPEPSSSPSFGSSRLWMLTTTLALAVCGYFLYAWEPVDYHNIGNVRADEYLSYGPIDVVYTWVNGTDPRWKREKEYWHKHWIASLTGQPLPKKPEDTKHVKGSDTSNADNRFRDNEELRYSLRSLEKYAPWIRDVYIVTDGQVPSWLNLESPHLHIVKHADIFENKSHLPVFSSPAIEWNLDNIPNLSEHFLYFNDDVFLGSYVHPEDFISQKGVQKVYFAWEVPLCSTGCWDSWLQNGRCDPQCNVTACDFDMGDCGCDVNAEDGTVLCDPIKIAKIQEATPKPTKIPEYLCAGTCQYKWIGDATCDHSCNITACGFDGGDCGMSPMKELYTATMTHNHTLVQVPRHVNATYLNLTNIFGMNGRVQGASHDNDALVRHATVFEQDLSVLLVFGRDEESEPLTESALVRVEGVNGDGHGVTLDFELVRGFKPIIRVMNETAVNGSVPTGYATFRNTSIKAKHIRLPLGFRQAEWTVTEVAIERNVTTTTTIDIDKTTASKNDDDVEGPPVETYEDAVAHGLTTTTTTTTTMEPQLEILLPFNVTDKTLKRGEVIALVMDVKLRLHDDQAAEDVFWLDEQTCLIKVPGGDPKKTKKTVTVSVSGDATETTTQDSNEDETPQCVLNERGVVMTLRLPTHGNVDEFMDNKNDDGSTVGDEEPKAKAVVVDDSPTVRPQVLDGQICFYNADLDTKQYCFALALGQYQSDQVVVAPRPPPPPTKAEKRAKLLQEPYVPYTGENSAWLECIEHCVDTTRRLIGIRPRRCYPKEIPATFKSTQVKDPKVANAEEGRRLACEAMTRRRQQQEEDAQRRQHERDVHVATLAADHSVLGTLRRWMFTTREWIHSRLDLSMVEETDEDLEDVEYDDVCKPFLNDASSTSSRPPTSAMTAENAEALLSKDTFGDSLRFVNKLYNRVFGKAPTRRRVPSHMPFLLSRSIIREIKTKWPREFAATSSHRFRHPQDMQFSFSYFHYLLNRHKIVKPTIETIWHEYLDVNRNGILDENELLTVASLAHGDYPPDTYVDEVRTCLRPPKQEKVMEKATRQGTVLVAETLTPHITLDHLKVCTEIVDKLIKHVRRDKKFELMSEDEVTFHMLSDQYRYAWNQMLGTRARRTKFVCINDDMKFPSKAVAQILHELFLSIWPKRSQFELAYHLKNRYDHIDEYTAARERREMYGYMAMAVAVVLVAIFWSDLKKIFGFQDIARARAESASQLSAEWRRRETNEDDEDHDHDE